MQFLEDMVATYRKPETLRSFTLRRPPLSAPTAARASSSSSRRTKVSEDFMLRLLEEFPFLDESDIPVRKPRAFGRAVRKAAGEKDPEEIDDSLGSESEPEADEDWAEDDMERFAEELADIRAELAGDADETYFSIHVLGGKWTKAKKGVVADGCGGFARKGIATKWCTKYGFKKQAAQMFTRYGRENARLIALEYCTRGHFFFGLKLASDMGDAFQYTQADIDSYAPSEKWCEFMTGLDLEDVSFVRGLTIQGYAPKVGPV